MQVNAEQGMNYLQTFYGICGVTGLTEKKITNGI